MEKLRLLDNCELHTGFKTNNKEIHFDSHIYGISFGREYYIFMFIGSGIRYNIRLKKS